MADSVYQSALGAKFARLAPELRAYFAGADASVTGIGTGVFETAGSPLRWLRPMLAYLGWRRILFPEYDTDVPFEVTNQAAPDGSLSALRRIRFAGREQVLEDTMRVVDGSLHDFLGKRRGLEARLQLEVRDDGSLAMRSDRLWLHLASVRIPLPRFAAVTIDESWQEGRQHVDVQLTSPVLGSWFRYAGSFDYRYVTSREPG